MRSPPRSALLAALLAAFVGLHAGCDDKKPDKRTRTDEPSQERTPASGSAGRLSFDDVPGLAPDEDAELVDLLFEGSAMLPAHTLSVGRTTIVHPGIDVPPIVRAAVAAGAICGGPPLSRIASNGEAAPEAVADLLLDRARLRDWLACGRSAAIATRFTFRTLRLRGPEGAVPLSVTLVPKLDPPAFFDAPREPITGLVDLRCSRVTSGVCEHRSWAMARIDRFDLYAVGELASLVALAGRPSEFWRGTTSWSPPLFPAETRGRDIDLLSVGADSLGFMDMAINWSDNASFDGRQALLKALDGARAVSISTIASSYQGSATLRMSVAPSEELDGVVIALQQFRSALRAAPLTPTDAPSLEDDYYRAIEAMTKRAIIDGTIDVTGKVLSLHAQVRPSSEDAERLERYRKARSERLLALARLLAAAVDGATAEPSDLALIGGPRLPQLMESRAGRKPVKAALIEPLQGFPGVEVPVSREQTPRGPSVDLIYGESSGATIDSLLDTLAAQGFEFVFERIGARGPMFRASRGAQSLQIRITRSDPMRITIATR